MHLFIGIKFKIKFVRKFFSEGDTRPDLELSQDTEGHGTMVAGVIVNNGPANVKILNIKVT